MLNINNIYKKFGNLKVLEGVSTQIKEGEVVAVIGASGSGKSTLLRCMNLLETPTFGEVWMDGKLLTPVDPYLHPEIIMKTNTYKKLVGAGMDSNDAISKIKAEDLINEKFSAAEGKEYLNAMKEYYQEHHIDINLARQDMGMVFQQFNLFPHMTILKNMTLAPIKLLKKSKEEAEETALKLLEARFVAFTSKNSNIIETLNSVLNRIDNQEKTSDYIGKQLRLIKIAIYVLIAVTTILLFK